MSSRHPCTRECRSLSAAAKTSPITKGFTRKRWVLPPIEGKPPRLAILVELGLARHLSPLLRGTQEEGWFPCPSIPLPIHSSRSGSPIHSGAIPDRTPQSLYPRSRARRESPGPHRPTT